MKNHIPTSADYNAKQEFENYKGVEVSFYDSNNRLRIAEIKDFDNETNQLLCYDKKVNQNFYIPFENLQKANTWIAEKLKGILSEFFNEGCLAWTETGGEEISTEWKPVRSKF